MCCSIASQISSLTAIRQFVQWRESAPLLIGGAAGVPIALYFLTLTNAHVFQISVAIFLVSYAIYMLTKPAFGVVRQAAIPVIRTIGGLCGRARRRPNGDAGLIADHLVRPARCFKRTSKGRGSTVHSHHAGLCPYPAHSSARHTSSQPTPGSPVGNSRGCRRHPPRHFAVGQDRQCQIPLFRAVDAVDLTKPRPLLVGRPRARIHNDLVGGFSSPSRHVMHVPTGYAATGAMPSCSQEFATSHTVARCRSRFQRRSSN
jgi:hypothetical protein